MIVIISIAVILGGLLIYQKFFYKEPVETPVNTVTVTNTIDEYGYTLEDRDTALFEEKFHELETLLNQAEFDQEEYVSLVSQLFIIDFYTIDNKISRYEDNPDKLMEQLNKVFSSLNREFKYEIHQKTNRIMISVKDTETGDIIKQIPSEESLDFFAKTLEMAGLLVDQKG